jgi:hypothetical protein
MKSQMLRKIATTGLMASILSSGLALGAERPAARESAQPVARQKTERKETAFKSERTDSWLCNNVSVFFCSNLFPTVGSANSASATPAVPNRSRHD